MLPSVRHQSGCMEAFFMHEPPLCDSKQFYIKNQDRASGNARLTEFSITHLSRNIYLPTVTDMHLLQSDYPPFYQIAQTDSQRHTPAAGIKLLSVDSLPCIVNGDNAPDRRTFATGISRQSTL